MLLERLKIQGFQSHVDTDITFDSKNNVVKGDNASGKSAIRRAILWVLTNKPSGTAFINWEFKDNQPCEVSLWYDGHCVTRRRSRDGKINEYIVDGDVLTAFGVGLPPIVASIFKLDDTNIELQHSALFMLSESAPDMARRLNKLTNLESIDIAYGSLRKRKLDAGRKLKDAQERHASLEKELEKYEFLDNADIVVELLEASLAEVIEYQTTLQDANALISDLSLVLARIQPHAEIEVNEVVESYNALVECGRDLADVDKTLDAVQSLVINEHAPFNITTFNDLKEDIQETYTQWKEVCALSSSIAQLSTFSTPPISSKDIDIQKIKDIINEFMDVQLMLDGLKKVALDIQHTAVLRDRMREEYATLMPATCPLCGSITHDGRCV